MARSLAFIVGHFILLWPALAHAHLVDIRFGDFYGGAIHLLTGLQYALTLVALSLFAAMQEKKIGRWMLLVAPLGILLGAVAATGLDGQSVSLWINAALAFLGCLIALGFRLPILALVLCGGLCAILLGYENGLAITTASDKPLFLMGLTVAALVVVCLVTAGLTQLRSIGKAIPIAMRAVGSWIAAVAIILFALGPAA